MPALQAQAPNRGRKGFQLFFNGGLQVSGVFRVGGSYQPYDCMGVSPCFAARWVQRDSKISGSHLEEVEISFFRDSKISRGHIGGSWDYTGFSDF